MDSGFRRNDGMESGVWEGCHRPKSSMGEAGVVIVKSCAALAESRGSSGMTGEWACGRIWDAFRQYSVKTHFGGDR